MHCPHCTCSPREPSIFVSIRVDTPAKSPYDFTSYHNHPIALVHHFPSGIRSMRLIAHSGQNLCHCKVIQYPARIPPLVCFLCSVFRIACWIKSSVDPTLRHTSRIVVVCTWPHETSGTGDAANELMDCDWGELARELRGELDVCTNLAGGEFDNWDSGWAFGVGHEGIGLHFV